MNILWLRFDLFCSSDVHVVAQNAIFHEHLSTVWTHLIRNVFGFYAGDTYTKFA
jgi:hypothetical protein